MFRVEYFSNYIGIFLDIKKEEKSIILDSKESQDANQHFLAIDVGILSKHINSLSLSLACYLTVKS